METMKAINFLMIKMVMIMNMMTKMKMIMIMMIMIKMAISINLFFTTYPLTFGFWHLEFFGLVS